MKNKIKQIGIAIFVLAIIFLFAACDKNKGGIPTNFRFRNQTPPASLNLSIARSVMGGTTTDTASYSTYNNYYTTHANIIQSVTPAAFKLYEFAINADVNGPVTLNHGTIGRLIDFVQGTTLSVDEEIPEGISTPSIMIEYEVSNEYSGVAKTPATSTFTVTNAVSEGNPNLQGATFCPDRKTVTVRTDELFPAGFMPKVPGFIYTGTVYKFVTMASSVPPFIGGGAFVTPWAGASTSGMSSITFNVNWDVTNLIQQRCSSGSGTNHACDDCVYVLADKFWERFSFTVN